MLRANEIQQRITHIQQTIDQAEQACLSAADTSPELTACIRKLAQEAKQAESVIASNDQARIAELVPIPSNEGFSQIPRSCQMMHRNPIAIAELPR